MMQARFILGWVIFRAVLTDKGNDLMLSFSRFLAHAPLVPEVFLDDSLSPLRGSLSLFREEKFQEKPLQPGYARAIFRENLV